jgi:hypothetical protein
MFIIFYILKFYLLPIMHTIILGDTTFEILIPAEWSAGFIAVVYCLIVSIYYIIKGFLSFMYINYINRKWLIIKKKIC